MNCGIYNLFIRPSKKYIFCIICKNACTYLKHITLCNMFQKEAIPNYHIACIRWGKFLYPKGQNYKINPKIDTIYREREFIESEFKIVYVWRDPFERFVSLYNDKVIGSDGVWYTYEKCGITQNTTFEEFLKFAKEHIEECRKTGSIIEEHIRPQIDYYTTHVDYVVKIEDLPDFIIEKGISEDTSFINHHPHNLEEYEKFREQVANLYSCDLNILKNYKDKIYVPKE